MKHPTKTMIWIRNIVQIFEAVTTNPLSLNSNSTLEDLSFAIDKMVLSLNLSGTDIPLEIYYSNAANSLDNPTKTIPKL